jgi:hypothetical protein
LEARTADLVVMVGWREDFFIDDFRSFVSVNLLLNERLRSDRESCDGGTECGEVECGRGVDDTIAFQDDIGLAKENNRIFCFFFQISLEKKFTWYWVI